MAEPTSPRCPATYIFAFLSMFLVFEGAKSRNPEFSSFRNFVDLLTLFYDTFFEVFCEVDADLVAGVFDSHLCHVVVNHDFHEFLK